MYQSLLLKYKLQWILSIVRKNHRIISIDAEKHFKIQYPWFQSSQIGLDIYSTVSDIIVNEGDSVIHSEVKK